MRPFPPRGVARSRLPRLLPLLLPLLLLLASACEQAAPPPRSAPVVRVATAERGPLPFVVVASGQVEPNRFVAVQSQVTGVLTRVAIEEGQVVRRGDLLFEIDARPFRTEVDRLDGILARDEAQLARARRDSARYADLAAQGYATREQLDQILGNVAALAATVDADRAAVDGARFDLGNATVRAPIGGRTGQLAFREGNVVRALGDAPLVTINEVSPVLVRFAVPERAFAELRARAGVDAELPVRIRPAAAPEGAPPIEGTLAFVDNAVDQRTGAVTLKARVPNTDGALWPGQFVTVELELAVEPDVVHVPRTAVVPTATGQFVFVVATGDTARRLDVTVARDAGDRAVIARGLAGGERVIVDGQQRVADGGPVSVQGLVREGPPPAPAAGGGE